MPIPRLVYRPLLLTILIAGAESRAGAEAESVEPDAKRAYGYLAKICEIGTRVSGTAGMTRQQRMIVDHFSALGASIRFQSFDVAHPVSGLPVRMNNLVVSWDPDAKKRVLLACHYDTRPYPDRDPRNPRGIFLGANDGASGVALFMEMGHFLQDKQYEYGIDMVFFDGEELVYKEGDKYFLGSEYFSADYRDNPPEYEYVWGVLVDMIADRSLQIYVEQHSHEFAPELTESIWDSAKQIREKAFIPRIKHAVNDDHIPLNKIAKIPTCDIIDFDYRHWHTTADTPQNCSGASLVRVANVLLHWLERIPPPRMKP